MASVAVASCLSPTSPDTVKTTAYGDALVLRSPSIESHVLPAGVLQRRCKPPFIFISLPSVGGATASPLASLAAGLALLRGSSAVEGSRGGVDPQPATRIQHDMPAPMVLRTPFSSWPAAAEQTGTCNPAGHSHEPFAVPERNGVAFGEARVRAITRGALQRKLESVSL